MVVFWQIETGLSTLTGYSIGQKTRPLLAVQAGRMVATIAPGFLPYGVMAVGREVPKTPGGWLFWLGLGAVLVLVFRGLGGNSDPRTRGLAALVVLGGGLLVFVVWVLTGGQFPPP
jgi:hypothetical protein